MPGAPNPTTDRSFKLLEAGRATVFRKEGFIPAEFKANRLKDNDNANFDARKVKFCDEKAKQQHVATNTTAIDDEKKFDSSDFDEGSEAAVVDGIVNDSITEILIDTGASTNLIQAEKLFSLDRFARILPYKGRLESADGKTINVLGRAVLELKLGSICEEIHVLVLQNLKPQMILGLKEMKRHGCTIDFRSNEMWTGSKESSAVVMRMVSLTAVGSYRYCRETEIDPSMQDTKFVSDHQLQAVTGASPKETDYLMAAQLSRETQVKYSESNYVSETEDEEWTDTDDEVLNWVAHTVYKAQDHPTLDQEVDQILELSAPGVSGVALDRLRTLVREYRDVFALKNNELGCTDIVQHQIDTGDTPPIKKAPHRISPAKIPIIQEELKSMLEKGVIQPSSSPYSAPIVLQKKKDGSWRFCVDYRDLNDVTVKDAFPIPKIDQSFDALRGAKFFSSLDLASGYWQVPVAPEDRQKTAFVTPDGGLYEYIKMPFGLSNAPGTFQRLMNNLFKDHLWKWVLIFLDDVLAYDSTEEEHFKHIEVIFKLLRAANLKLKPKKCRLLQQKVVYLSHVIDKDGARPDPQKVAAVREWPEPKTVKQVRSFVGFCNYYRRFVKDFAQIARPLHELTKKNARFEWTPCCQMAFDRLRLELATAPVLQFPRYDCPFIIDTDASNVSLGAVLSNFIDGVEHPIVFASRSLSKTETMYSTTKREALAVVQALKWFKHYIWGLSFVIRTDHASLKWLFRQNADGMTFRMLQHLQEFNYEIVHRAGNKHANADGLSRMTEEEPEWEPGEKEQVTGQCPEPQEIEEALKRVRERCAMVDAITETIDDENEEGVAITWTRTDSDIERLQQEDEAISRILYWAPTGSESSCSPLGPNLIPKEQAVQHGPEVVAYWSRWSELVLKNRVLYRKWFQPEQNEPHLQLIVPVSCRKKILDQLHTSPVSGGHFKVEKTLLRIRQRFWWPFMRRDIEKKLSWCLPCAARTTAGRQRTAELSPFKVGIRFHTVAADILGPVTLAARSRAKYILVMTDLFTKYAISVPLVVTEAKDVAKEIVECWVLHFGVPDVLHTDQGKNFGSDLIKELCKLLKMDKTRTSPYHPQGNGQVERHNRVIADVLSKYCAENPRDWDTMLPYVNFVYNKTIHRTTGATPFSLVYGQECQYPIDLFYPKPHDQERTQNEFVDWLDRQFREAHSHARELLGVNQNRQKDQFHKKVFGKPYEVDDKVWVFSKHKAKSKKFFLPWEGPYIVLERTSEVNYKVSKPQRRDKWRILHYNLLKPFVEEEPETSDCRATPFRSTNFYEEPLEIDEWEQLDPDPIPRPPILVPRNRIQVPQPAVGQEDGVINNPIVEQSADQLGGQAAPDSNSRENDPEYQRQLVQRQLESHSVGESRSPDAEVEQATRANNQNSVEEPVELRRSARIRAPVIRLGIDE